MSFPNLLNLTATLKRGTESRTSTGGVTKSYATISSSLKVRILESTVSESSDNLQGNYLFAPFTVYVKTSIPIYKNDIITTTEFGELQVIKPIYDSSIHHYQLQCKKIDN